jgi:translocation and assembly module TamB
MAAPPRPPPTPARHLLGAFVFLSGVALLLFLAFQGALLYVRTPGGTARLLSLGLHAANEAIAGHLEAEGATIHGSHVVVRRAILKDPGGREVASVEEVDADIVWGALLLGHIEARTLHLTRPSFALVFDGEGSNVDATFSAKHPGPVDTSGKPAPLTFIAHTFEVTQGRFVLQTPEGPPFVAQALELQGGGFYALRSQDFQLEARGNGAVDQPTAGPLTLTLSMEGRANRFSVDADLRAAGATLAGALHTNPAQPLEARVALDVAPTLARALVPGWPLRVALALSAETHPTPSGLLISAKAAAGRTRVEVSADVDAQATSARNVRLEARHLNLVELLGRGPQTDFALSARGSLKGTSWAKATGQFTISLPASSVRGAEVGPVEASLALTDGRLEASSLHAVLPGMDVHGSGRGNGRLLEAALQVEVSDLAASRAALQDIAPLPPLSGNGALHVQLKGHPSHPGIEATGQFGALGVGPFASQALELAVHVPDTARPLDASGTFKAGLLTLDNRTVKDVDAALQTEGNRADLRLQTPGPIRLHLAGAKDADARGFLLDTLALDFPEESWGLKAPAAVRLDGGHLKTERVELVSSGQSVAFQGGLVLGQLDASLQLAHLELAHLPTLLVPAAMKLAGTLDMTAVVHGPGQHPDFALQANLSGGGFHGLKDVQARLDAQRRGQRIVVTAHLGAFGSTLDVEVDAPILALTRRVHQPLKLHLVTGDVDVARVLCEVASAGFFAAGCPHGTAALAAHAALDVQLDGQADAPAVHLGLSASQLQYAGLSAAQASVHVDGDAQTPLSAKVSAQALLGTLSAEASFGEATGALLARRRSWAGFRDAVVSATLEATGLQLAQLQQAGLVSEDVKGTVAVQAKASGTLGTPEGQADVDVSGLVLPPWPGGEAHFSLLATQAVEARLSFSGPKGEKGLVQLHVGAPLLEILARPSAEAQSHAELQLSAELGPFALRDMPLGATRLRRDRRLLDGELQVHIQGQGTLLAPTLSATLTATGLGPSDGAHFEGVAQLHSANAKQSLDMQLKSATGGSLQLQGEVGLDVSLAALHRGLRLGEAPLTAHLHSEAFEPDFVASFIPALRSISGKLEIEGQASGTLGHPEVKGTLSWTQGAVGVIGFGVYQDIQLKASASNSGFAIERLAARVQGGNLSLKLSGTRAAKDFSVQGTLSAQNLPVVFDDQLWCIATLQADLAGSAREWLLDLNQVNVSKADLQLPEARRRDLQDLRSPADVILTRHGVPIDAGQALRALGFDPRRRRSPGATALASSEPLLRLNLEAPNHIAVRSKDVALELGLSRPFQVDVGAKTEIVGVVHILRGRADVFGRRFEVQPGGQVRFDGPPNAAQLDVTGVYSSVQSQAKVYMHLSGDVTNVKVTPSSDPPMAESEIYTLLATGRTSLVQSSLGSSTSVGGGEAGASILGSWAATQLKRAVGVALPIDVLSVEVNNDERGINQTRLEAGKYLTDDIYIGYQARTNADPFRYQNANAIRVEYRFLRRWSLQLEYGDANAGSLDAVWSRDY